MKPKLASGAIVAATLPTPLLDSSVLNVSAPVA